MAHFFTSDKEKTFQYQDSLPSLPAPDFENTLKKYLESVKPHLTESEFQQTSLIVQQFGNGVGRELNQEFLQQIKGQRNWLEKLWEEKAYLQWRMPTNPYVNITGPGPYLNNVWPPKEGSQVERASLLLHFVLRFWQILRKQQLKVDKSGKNPLCMNQYRRLFNACKRPGLEMDELHFHFKTEDEGPCATHVTVLCKGRIFSLNGCASNNELLTPPELQKQLQHIRDICDREPEGLGLGALTCDDRNVWAEMYNHLKELHPDNEKSLMAIETSLLTLCLDDSNPPPQTYSDLGTMGVGGNSKCRWADKSVSFALFSNGTTISNLDHAPFDGMVYIMATFFTDACLQESGGTWQGSTEIRNSPNPVELNFRVDKKIEDAVESAFQKHKRNSDSISAVVLHYTGYGKNFIRKYNFHPDTYSQIALQYTYYRIYKRPAPTYETSTIRKFWHARTETVRSCTSEAIDWAKAMLDSSVPASKKLVLMKAAHDKHISNMIDCSNFKGCDRHLFALYYQAIEKGMDIPELFTDKAFSLSGGGGNFILSTSFLGHTPVVGGCAPMCENGYGVFNSIEPERMSYFITCWKADKETDCLKLFNGLSETYEEMQKLLESSPDALQSSKL